MTAGSATKDARKDQPLEFDPKKFPRGISYLADYAHQRGMKLGIYSGPGRRPAPDIPAAKGTRAEDAKMFASWGVDHLKYDSCCSHREAPKGRAAENLPDHVECA